MDEKRISEADFYKGLYDAVISKSIPMLLKLSYSIWNMPISIIDIDYNVLGMYPVKDVGDSTYDIIIKTQKISKEEKKKFIDEKYLMSLHMCNRPFIIDWGVAYANHRYSYKLSIDGIMYGAMSMVLLNGFEMDGDDEAKFMKIAEAAAKIASSSSKSVQISANSKNLMIRFLLTGVDVSTETAKLYLDSDLNSGSYRLVLGTSEELESPFYSEDLLKRIRIALPDAYINIIDNRLYTVLMCGGRNDTERLISTVSRFGDFRLYASDEFSDITKLRTYRDQVDFLSTMPYSRGCQIMEYRDSKIYHIASYIPKEARDEIIRTNRIQALKDYDAKYNTDLLETLKVYSRNVFDSRKTSEELNVHRNTLLNRLNRIEQIASLSMDSEKDIFDIILYFVLTEYDSACRQVSQA